MGIITQKSSSDPASLLRSGGSIPVHQRGEEQKSAQSEYILVSFLPLWTERLQVESLSLGGELDHSNATLGTGCVEHKIHITL